MSLTQGNSVRAAIRLPATSTKSSQDTTAKRLVKVVVSALVHTADRVPGRRPLAERASGLVVLYHDVPAAERARFARQLDMLRVAGTPVPCAAFPSQPTGEWHVAVTFDDGLESFEQVARPELDRRGIPATMFAISGLLREHEAEVGPTHEGMPVMTRGSIARLPELGHEVGSHSEHHRRLSLTCDDETLDELLNSRKQLEALVELPVSALAFPFGDWTSRTVKLAVEAGYDRIYSVNPDLVGTPRADHFVTGRIVVAPSDWRIETWLKLRGSYRWVASWTHTKERLHGRR